MLNKQKGNMYGFVTHTWNTIKGSCPHDCAYCYMKRWGGLKTARFDETELRTNLETWNTIFVGSSCDMWADQFPDEWIYRTLEHCRNYDFNRYFFQTKNPKRFLEFLDFLPHLTTLCTTVETNKDCLIGNGIPSPRKRLASLRAIRERKTNSLHEPIYGIHVTIEPVMDFDVEEMFDLIVKCVPDQVNIGADSGGNKLPEPSPRKVRELINALNGYTKIYLKPNLKRLLGRR